MWWREWLYAQAYALVYGITVTETIKAFTVHDLWRYASMCELRRGFMSC
ncbi:hypothetical protein AA106556_0885 [Neokomagataea tanensis NBRC 106556]|uniref:Transposase n=1 Tax=Neokomagataea tanensis NBRC 106556 TaxID=1223519 RepID=A0ABQ0QI78_9PROT|nr:hypothetical protein AA106556_0885 [Neokomagataea tanensis NBRC 106556]